MLRDVITFVEIVGLIALALGLLWLRIKAFAQHDKGLGRKSGIQTLFDDEHKWCTETAEAPVGS